MNKPYFTKYIPVEGEIKAESWGYNTKHGTVVYLDKLDYEELEIYNVKHVYKPVKLFLCSRDPQQGGHLDLAYYLSIGLEYKVIGEVSKEAIWVKENMEFEEKDIFKEFAGFACPGGNIKFRCSQCNTFH